MGSISVFLVLLLSSIVLVSISSASILVLLSGAPSYACAFWRLTISLIVLFSYGVLSGKRIIPCIRKLLLYSMVSGVFLGAHFLLWMESLFHIPVAVSTTIVVAFPLYNIVIDKVLFRESITRLQLIGFVMGFTGVLLFLHPSIIGDYSVYGVLLAMGGSLAVAVYFCIGRFVRRYEELLPYVIPAYSCGVFTVLIYIIVIGGELLGYSLRSYVFFVLLALIPMIGGHTVMNYLLRFMKTSSVTAIALGEPIGASILAYILLGQTIGFSEAVLMAVVLSSVFLIVYEEARGK
ncbi:DMT family transporter [Desulfurococcaceae archaeon MEX13E-LK6-19]|nr:DMT family transporter [Desulfurococcaceae archaeon MEX13E-LK6-19]